MVNLEQIKKGDKVRVTDGSIWLVHSGPDDDKWFILQEINEWGDPTDYYEEEAYHQIIEVLN